MKKRTLGVAAMATAALFAATVVNAQQVTITDNAGNGTTTVKYGVSGGYELVIPDNVNFTSAGTLSGTVKASNVLIEQGRKLQVTVTSTNNWNLVNNGSTIAYTVKKGTTEVANNDVVLEVEAGTAEGNTSLTFETTTDAIAAATKSGDHTDTLTFTAAVK